jgi:hypothetical protein
MNEIQEQNRVRPPLCCCVVSMDENLTALSNLISAAETQDRETDRQMFSTITLAMSLDEIL